jgi:hypothetical protein
MPITRLSFILPAVQVPVAMALWEWGIYQRRAPGFGAWPTAGLVCYGINAPAILPSKLVAYPFRMMYPPHFLAHYSLQELAFFASVGVVWFLAGMAIDRKRRRPGTAGRLSLRGVLWYLFLVLEAIFLFLQALQGFALPWHRGNYWGTIAESILFLAWALVLVGTTTLRFMKQQRSLPTMPA